MTRILLNGKPVRVSFEDQTLYFVWSDFATAAGLPEKVVRRIPKTIGSFEKKNIRAARKDGADARILAVTTCGLYRFVQYTTMIAQRRETQDWIMKVYTMQAEAMRRAPDRDPADVEEAREDASGANREAQVQKVAATDRRPSSKDEMLGLIRENMNLLSRILEMEEK